MDAAWLVNHNGSSIACANDTQGNSFILGTFQGNLTIGSSNLSSIQDTAIFVGKYDNNGTGVWGTIIGYFLAGFSIQGNGEIVVDEDDNIFGVFSYGGSTVRYVTNPLFGQDFARNTTAVFRLDSNQHLTYVQTVIHDQSQYFRIATDGNQNAYVSGNYAGTILTANATRSTRDSSDSIFFSLDPKGAYIWINTPNTIDEPLCGCTGGVPSIFVSSGITFTNGKLYGTGSYSGSISVGNLNFNTSKDQQEYLLCMNAGSGSLLFFINLNYSTNPTASSYGSSISSTSEAIYQAGLVFPFDPLQASTYIGEFRKFDLNGALVWETYVEILEFDNENSVLLEIATDQSGVTYAYGSFSDDVNFGSFPLTSDNIVDHYVATLDDSGAWTSAILVIGKIKIYGKDVAASEAGEAFISGTFEGELKIGKLNVNSTVTQFFLSKII